MDYRVEELADAAGVGVDTVRYYQGRKLLPPPRREGRVGWYGAHHLERLLEIRDLAQRGFTLSQIRELADAEGDRLLADLAQADAPDPDLDRAELARRAEVPELIVDIAVGAGLLSSSGEPGNERFAPDSVEMLAAARDLVSEGAPLGELTALAMRHVSNIDSVIDDAIELFKNHSDESGGDRDDLVATMHRLVPVASSLVGRHFERTLRSRALARLSDEGDDSDCVVVVARQIGHRIDPVGIYHSSTDEHRTLWVRPDEGFFIVALGAAEIIETSGDGRFTAASARREALAARVSIHTPSNAPRPVLVGGLSFEAGDDQRSPDWSGFPDSRWILPATTYIETPEATWVTLAAVVADGEDETEVLEQLQTRLESMELPDEVAADDDDPVSVGAVVSDDLAYRDLVDEAVSHIAGGHLAKVVLARVHHDDPVDPATVLARLRQRYPTCAVFAYGVGDRTFLGASPEMLVALEGSQVQTVALAGTAPRGIDPDADEGFAQGLLDSSKIRAEHGFVVDDITQRLATLGLVGRTSPVPEVLRLARVQHLRTPITAKVERHADGGADVDVLRIASVLHPTPAVGGTPTEDALDWIRDHETFDRGWYAAPVGWCDLDGNGELRVALRSALAGPSGVDLFAGAGIVADSVPDDELEETGVKLRALLDVMDR